MENKPKFYIIFLFIIILLIGGLLYYFFYYSKKSSEDIILDSIMKNEINESNELAIKEGNKLVLQLDDGTEKIILDIIGGGDVYPETENSGNHSEDTRIYTFDKFYKDINYYGVFVKYYVGMDSSSYYLLINKKNGNQVPLLSSNIVISPDKQRIFSHNLDLESGFTVNGFEIILNNGDNFISEYQLEPKDWGPSSPLWLSDSEVEFNKIILNDNYELEMIGIVRYKLVVDKFGNNKWVEVK